MFIVILPFWASGEQKYQNVKPTFENKRLSKEEKKQWHMLLAQTAHVQHVLFQTDTISNL